MGREKDRRNSLEIDPRFLKKTEKEKVGYSVNPSGNKVLEKLVSYLEKIKLDIQFPPD